MRVLHLSDVHIGKWYVAAHVEAAVALAASLADAPRADGTPGLDAIVMSGDLSQRARPAEFREARALLERLGRMAPVLAVPGNHDAEWWHAPFGAGSAARLHETWHAEIGTPLEPTLRVPGLSIVGLNSAAGMLPQALTWYPRDWRVKGGLTTAQLHDAQARLGASPDGDLRLLVLHHNVVRGQLSRRWGLARPRRTLDALLATAPHVICTGHDHEEQAVPLKHAAGETVVSAANTLSTRARGKRVVSVNVIEADAQSVQVAVWRFDAVRAAFAHGMAASVRRT